MLPRKFFGRRLMPVSRAFCGRRYYMARLVILSIFLGAWIVLLSGCATRERAHYHIFDFDTLSDSPEIKILDYQYGDCNNYGICANRQDVEKGRTYSQEYRCGNYPRGRILYVKWQIIESGKICEDRVDLDKRLPKDIDYYRIRLVIRGEQLFIYLLPPPGRWMGIGLREPITARESAWTRNFIIYPDKPWFYPDRIME